MEVPTKPRSRRRAFTLIELLAVMVIIGILSGLISAAVIAARSAARRAAIRLEIDQLAQALEAYKSTFGEYPPDFSNQTLVIRHLQRAYPRCTISDWSTFSNTLNSNFGIQAGNLNPGTALVFWLGGLSYNKTSKQLIGFSADPADPFKKVSGNVTAGSRKGPFHEFDPARLVGKNYPYSYKPDTGSSVGDAPYVYFRARPGAIVSGTSMAYDPGNQGVQWGETSGGTVNVCPYYNLNTSSNVSAWYNPNSFQIICAGLDGLFGSVTSTTGGGPAGAAHIPAANNFSTNSTGIYDNMTNFLRGRVEDEL